MAKYSAKQVRRLVIILGDQLGACASQILEPLDPTKDMVWMAEVSEESTHVWCHKARTAIFLSAMRHYRDSLKSSGLSVCYNALEEHNHTSLSAALDEDLKHYQPKIVLMIRAGEMRVQRSIETTVNAQGIELQISEDPTFLIDVDSFSDWIKGRKQPRMEHFYRWMRKQTGYLMDNGEPTGGQWNFDKHNRGHFGRKGPGLVPPPPSFPPDVITTQVISLVNNSFPDHPGCLDWFDWPVTPEDAHRILDDFVAHRLPLFGKYQDAMWADEPFLYHSLLSAAMNLKLIEPRQVLEAAVDAWQKGQAPLASVEGFVRQILGWREYVRGVYMTQMPGYLEHNALGANQPLPDFFWSGETDMHCLRQVIEQTLNYGYAHHIQRLMVTGLFCLLLGVKPSEVHAWYLAVYVDAVEWVELPNTLGMSQYADGGWLASKPYVASGRYIQRMSNYCGHCRYDPGQATGDKACPFTTLYWAFLDKHRKRFARHPRTALQWKHIENFDAEMLQEIKIQASKVSKKCHHSIFQSINESGGGG